MKFDSLESLVRKCEEISERGTDIYIIGAGVYGTKIATVLKENKIEWKCFIDKLKTGECMGKLIMPYEKCGEGFYIISTVERYRNGVLNDLKNISGISDETCMAYLDTNITFYDQYNEILAEEALKYVINNFEFNTVLDVGCGEGLHSGIFADNGKCVTALDYGKSFYFQNMKADSRIKRIIADVSSYECEEQFDLVWCSNVLEHQLNPHNFLCKLHFLVKEKGILAITVPHLSTQDRVQGGHVSVWNAGLLLYHLVLAGFDCSEAHVKSYESNVGISVSVIVEKKTINVLKKLNYDRGDVRLIKPFLPKDIVFIDAGDDDHFVGDIQCLNWLEK